MPSTRVETKVASVELGCIIITIIIIRGFSLFFLYFLLPFALRFVD